MSKCRGYRFGVAWVAENDCPGDGDSEEDIRFYTTTVLLADLFDKEPKDVAKDIYRYREKMKTNDSRTEH